MLDKLYSKKESIVHKIDVKTKIIYTFIYILSLGLINNLVTLFISFISLIFLLIASKINFKKISIFIKSILPALISIAIMYKFVLDKDNFEILRTTSVLMFSTVSISCFVMTTKVTEMAKAIETMIPFKNIIPAYEISLMFTISLRFLPIFMKEYQRVKKAKICRGIYIEEMKLKERIKNIMGYFLPVFLLSLERAYNLAIAMETKGYRKKKRKLKWDLKRLDYLTFYMFIGYLILIIGGR